jgi:hypothetical protein
VHGLHVDYDWDGHDVQAVPPCIHMKEGDGPRVSDMRISGAWDAVSSLDNPNTARYYLANLFIVDCHHYGVAMGASFDFSTMDGVEVWAPTSLPMFHNGTGILIMGVDGLRASNLAVFRAAIGVSLQSQLPGMKPHGVWGAFANVNTDFCVQGMVINGSNTVQLSSGDFQSHETSLNIQGSGGTVRIAGSRFKSNGDAAVKINGSNVVTIDGNGFSRVFPSLPGPPALWIGKNETQTVLVTGCDMESSDQVAIECAGEKITPDENNNIVCAGKSAMLSSNFIRAGRNHSATQPSLAGTERRDWGRRPQ